MKEPELNKGEEYRITVTHIRPDVEARFVNTYHVLIDEEMPLGKTMSKIYLAFTIAHPGWPILSVNAYPNDGLPHPSPKASLKLSQPTNAQKSASERVLVPA